MLKDSKLTTSNLQLTRFLVNKVTAFKDKIDLDNKYKSNKQKSEDKQVIHSTVYIFVDKITNRLKIVLYCILDIIKGNRGLITTLKANI